MAKMTKREAVRWIKRMLAHEIRERLSEVPDHTLRAPDAELVGKLWQETTWDIADRIWPEES